MSVVRDFLWLVIENGNEVRMMTSTRPAETRAARPGVSVRQVPRQALQHALRLAGGDISRLRCEADGSVFVANASRRPTSPLTGRALGGGWR